MFSIQTVRVLYLVMLTRATCFLYITSSSIKQFIHLDELGKTQSGADEVKHSLRTGLLSVYFSFFLFISLLAEA